MRLGPTETGVWSRNTDDTITTFISTVSECFNGVFHHDHHHHHCYCRTSFKSDWEYCSLFYLYLDNSGQSKWVDVKYFIFHIRNFRLLKYFILFCMFTVTAVLENCCNSDLPEYVSSQSISASSLRKYCRVH